jgi:aryl-alcohol dehydrogenase-like predicted oxidoreductase
MRITKALPNNKEIHLSLISSISKLRCGYSPEGFLLHTPKFIYDFYVMHKMAELKDSHPEMNLGVSVYSFFDGLHAVDMGFDIIQIPYSVMDQQLDKTDFFKICRDNGVKVFARSAFLQGYLLKNPENLPENVKKWPYFKEKSIKFGQTSEKHGFSRVESCFLFSLTSQADFVVFGVDSLEQLKQNVEIYNRYKQNPGLFDECRAELVQEFGDMNLQIPSLWSKE